MRPETTPPRTVFVRTFGCQMNKLDSELVLGQLLGEGYAQAASAKEADVILYNTCSVRQHAEDKVFSYLGTLKREKQRRPGMIIGVIGCMAQRLGEEIRRRAPHVDLVCGTRMFPRLHELIEQAREGRPVIALDMGEPVEFDRDVTRRPARHRAFVSVMRGCDNFCTYCIVPHVRGREMSRPPSEIAAEVRALVEDGCREITLLGQTVNAYGKSLDGRPTLADLLRRLGDIDGLLRLRFITCHPKCMTADLFDAMAEVPLACQHLHLPAQAGSDAILRAMNRGYTRERYLEIIGMGRERVPDLSYASDFIVGFPGESEEQFEQTADLMRQVRYQNCFIFKYSPRPGTRAAEMDDSVPPEVKSRRNQALLKVQEEISRAAHEAMIGRTVEVLVDGPSPSDPARPRGRTRRNHIVVFDDSTVNAGDLVHVRIDEVTPLTLFGRKTD